VILEEVGLGFALDVVGHVLAQLRGWTVQQPQPPQRVLHQVAHDPVRGEQLGDGGDVFCRHRLLAGHHLFFFLGDIELIQPAQYLHVVAVGIMDRAAEARRDGAIGEQVIGQQQLGGVIEPLNRFGSSW